MNPLKINKVIKESKNNGERITIDSLSQRCNGRIRHRYVRMSNEMFECDECGGFPRHWVEGLSLRGWLTIWFYNPEKFDRVEKADVSPRELEIAQDMSEALKDNEKE